MLLFSFPCLSHPSGFQAKGQMFLIELLNHQEQCAFCVKLSGGGDPYYVNYHIVIGRMFIIF